MLMASLNELQLMQRHVHWTSGAPEAALLRWTDATEAQCRRLTAEDRLGRAGWLHQGDYPRFERGALFGRRIKVYNRPPCSIQKLPFVTLFAGTMHAVCRRPSAGEHASDAFGASDCSSPQAIWRAAGRQSIFFMPPTAPLPLLSLSIPLLPPPQFSSSHFDRGLLPH